MTPPGDTTGIGMEYFCFEDDDLWTMSDDRLCALASEELHRLGLASGCTVTGGFVVRVKKAYPLYDFCYNENLSRIRAWLSSLDNLVTLGRNGLHRYNNQDHSMIMALHMVDSLIANRRPELWADSADNEYLEELK